MNLVTVALYVFIITFFVLLVLFRFLAGRQRIRERVDSVAEDMKDAPSMSGLRGIIGQFSTYCESASWARQKEDLLVRAGVPFKGSEFMVISIGLALIGMLLLLLVSRGSFGLAMAGGIAVFYLPTFIVRRKIKKKQSLLNEQLPPALALMANSLRSGNSYMQAIDLVSQEMPYPMSEEFGTVIKEMNLGMSTEDAFVNLVKRVDTDDMDLTVTAFLIQRQVGGNLAELLDNIAQTIRERISMKQKISTITAQGKISAIVLSFLPVVVVVMLYLVNREYLMSFLNHPIGKLMTGLGLGLQGIGVVWMRKIVNIDV
ncbi:type ii secretion system (t2ss) protein f [Lucifera butyrica]|uniref:Type ii secretion system (T2ss) protein f n=1 Tax=Lucifera butyrica TaxID=1351585 RepID=A0A498RDB0_9FIRM|nr:type II secretion system F family protein [Lucifera butyrica]VBB09451.1 type ii secretion system (t2ss) protein f [Lucifera butyrica]